MKKLLVLGTLALMTSNVFASCYYSMERELADWKNLDESTIQVENKKEEFFKLLIPVVIVSVAYTMAKKEITKDYSSSDCSFLGTRLTADVSYYENGNFCTAKLVKPARFARGLQLNKISCN